MKPMEALRQFDESKQSRREFLTRGAGTGLGLAALGMGGLAHAQQTQPMGGMGIDLYPGAVDAQGNYVLPPLPYDYDALEPHIDEETMRLHHDKHHAGYVQGLIQAEEDLAMARQESDYSGVEHAAQKAAFHGAGHFLHCIFWDSMTPEATAPKGALLRAIERDFGSLDKCKELYWNVSKGVEGSGWGILAFSIPARKLVMLQARNHQLATQWANIPLLVVDVWEHAYYKKYSNLRGEYLTAFMNVVNWENVGKRYEACWEMTS